MKAFLSVTLAVVTPCVVLQANEANAQALSSSEVAEIQKLLQEADKETLGQEKLKHPDLCRKLIAYYLNGTNSIPTKAKKTIASCFGAEKRYREAIKLTEEYLQVYSNDWEGLSMLGCSLIENGSYAHAIPVFTNALANIDTNDAKAVAYDTPFNYSHLAKAALLAGRADVLESLATKFLEFRADQFISEELRQEAALAFVAYAIGARDQRLFAKTVATLDLDQIRSNVGLWSYLRLGCYVFQTRSLASIRLALQAAADKAVDTATEPERMPITSDEVESVRRKLREYEAGNMDFDALTSPRNCSVLMAYYLTGTNDITLKSRIALATCFGQKGNYSLASKIAGQYAQVFSNDWRGWFEVGLASYKERAYTDACAALTNSIHVGDINENVCGMLAMSAFMSGRLDVEGNLCPTLLKLRNSEGMDEEGKFEITVELLAYAISTNDQKLFVKSLEGITPEQILSNTPLRVAFFVGYNFFQPKEASPLWEAYRKAAANETRN